MFSRLTMFRNASQRLNSKIQDRNSSSTTFEAVFSFPSVKYVALMNRLKVYHFLGTSIVVPGCGILELLNAVPLNTFLATAYVGVTGAAVLSLFTFPFTNTIGFLYISEDNKKIKISSVDFWGKRKDRIISSEEWIPMLEMTPKITDGLFLSPKLTDGTTYKLPIIYGNVLNSTKMGQVLE